MNHGLNVAMPTSAPSMALIAQMDVSTANISIGAGAPQGASRVDDAAFIDSMIARTKTAAKTATQLPGRILDKGQAILDKAGETLGGIVEAVIPDNPDQLKATVEALGQLDQILRPERYMPKTDTGGQGEVSWETVRALVGLGASTAGGRSTPLTMDAQAGSQKPKSTSWPIILGLGAVGIGLVWFVGRGRR